MLSLSCGETVSLGSIPFTPQATADQKYDKRYDGVSLLFDARSGLLSARSRNQGTELNAWQIASPQITFSDVAPGDYFSQPVQWAVEQGITSGGGFADVPSGAGYAQAVAWAVSNGVTSGTSSTTFSPHANCSRGQIVTFLYRAFAEQP